MWAHPLAGILARDGNTGGTGEGAGPSGVLPVPIRVELQGRGDGDEVSVSDGAEFNDPNAWGYCELCKFEVARSLLTGRLLAHHRMVGSYSSRPCRGAGRQPKPKPAGDGQFPGADGKLLVRILIEGKNRIC